MVNLLVEKGASKDRDRSRSKITWFGMGTPTGFVKRSRLDFDLGTSPYIVDIFFSFIVDFLHHLRTYIVDFGFDIISVHFSLSPLPCIYPLLVPYIFSSFHHIISIFISINLIISSLF